MRKKWLPLVFMFLPALSHADNTGVFVGYELFEMSMNEFKNFAGEVGYKINDKHQVRLSIMDVKLTERHLSNELEAQAIKGDHVEGYFEGYELHYDTFFTKRWYYSFALGYYHDTYQHTVLPDKVDNKTTTIGGGIGYHYRNLFGSKNLYVNFDMPVRYYIDNIEETKLGDATVREHTIVSNLWLTVGLQF